MGCGDECFCGFVVHGLVTMEILGLGVSEEADTMFKQQTRDVFSPNAFLSLISRSPSFPCAYIAKNLSDI